MRKKRNSQKTIFFRNFRFFGIPKILIIVSRKHTKIRNFPKIIFVAIYPAINFRNFRLFGHLRNPEDSYYCIPKACENTKFYENYFCCNLSCYKFSQFPFFRAFSESNILNRGAGPGGVPAGTCPYVISESDVGLAGPVGVDSDTDGGGGAAT